jgi:hypothetical protein
LRSKAIRDQPAAPRKVRKRLVRPMERRDLAVLGEKRRELAELEAKLAAG